MKRQNFLQLGGLGVALGLALAGCSSNSPGESTPSPTATEQSGATATNTPTAAPSEEAPTPVPDPEEPPEDGDWSVDAQNIEAQNGTEQQVITDFRVGSHDGFDRVVLELSGTDNPGWMIDWTDHTYEQGRGQELDLTGPAFLNVNIMWIAYPIGEDLEKIAYTESGRLESGDVRAYFDSVFEGQAHLMIGMDQQRPYRVFTLTDPVRVVIDVQKP